MNPGAALLSKMGWTPGAGLGKDGAGITSALEAVSYAPGAGIGAVTAQPAGAAYDRQGTYQDRAKKHVFSRYDENRQ